MHALRAPKRAPIFAPCGQVHINFYFAPYNRKPNHIPSVNESTEKVSPDGTLDQMGTVLPRVIAAVAQTAEDEVVYFAKYNIKDGFWRLECEEGAEYNFAYVMPQEEGQPIKLVIPTSLQMGWTESPSYFNAASETVRDVADEYTQAEELDEHYLEKNGQSSWTSIKHFRQAS